jgi:hypothetical protein
MCSIGTIVSVFRIKNHRKSTTTGSYLQVNADWILALSANNVWPLSCGIHAANAFLLQATRALVV